MLMVLLSLVWWKECATTVTEASWRAGVVDVAWVLGRMVDDGDGISDRRYVVYTHLMALQTSLMRSTASVPTPTSRLMSLPEPNAPVIDGKVPLSDSRILDTSLPLLVYSAHHRLHLPH